MKRLVFVLFAIVTSTSLTAQRFENPDYSIDLGVGIGNVSSAGIMFRKNFYLGAKKNIIISPGVRLGYATAQSADYISAPADITSEPKNVDTVAFGGTNIISTSLAINLGYQFNKKLALIFDIDLFGLSLGKEQNGTFRPGENSSVGTNPTWKQPTSGHTASPSGTNLLLVGDRDLGTLSSAIAFNYLVTDAISIRLGAGFLFTEYTTQNKLGAAANDRWRAKSIQGLIGASYHF